MQNSSYVKIKIDSTENPLKFSFGKAFSSLLFLGAALFAPQGWAQAQDSSQERSWERSFIDTNIAISSWFDSVAEGLDLFLVGRRVTSRPNKSNVRVELSAVSTEGEPVANNVSLIVNPRLPNLEEYWHLKFTTYDEREDKRDTPNEYLRKTPRQTNYGATVGVFKKLGDVRTAFQPRIELRDPLRVSHSLSFESIAHTRLFEVNPKLEFYANPLRGVGTYQALNFYFILTKIWSMTLVNQGNYEEKFHLYSVRNGVSFGQILDVKSALSYNAFLGSNNQPNYHLESYNFSVTYSRILYRRILDFQLTPNIDIQRMNSFKPRAGITFNLSLNF